MYRILGILFSIIMSSLFTTLDTMRFVGTILESSFYGLYCVAFAVYMRIRARHKNGRINFAIYPLCTLFVLCTIFCFVDTAQTLFILRWEGTQDHRVGVDSYNMNITNTLMYCFITFAAQVCLLHRCWLMWGRKLIVIIIPSILAWLSFGASLAMIGALVEPPSMRIPDISRTWIYPLGIVAYSIAIAANGVITILLTIKIFLNFLENQRTTIKKGRINPIRLVTGTFNDSGMLMIGCQVIWLVLFRRRETAFYLVRGPIVMLYGLTPTLIRRYVTSPVNQTTSKEKPRNERATAVHFAI